MKHWAWLATILLALGCAGAARAADRTEHKTIWIEAEDTTRTNWTPGHTVLIKPDGAGASRGEYLRLYQEGAPAVEAQLPFRAEYAFTAPADGDYRFWLGVSPQAEAWCAPVQYSFDGGPSVSLKGKAITGSTYGAPHPEQFFCWTLAGAVPLKAGPHTLLIEVPLPRPMDKLYACFLDAMILTTDPDYVPAGNRPAGSPWPAWADLMKQMPYDKYVAHLEEGLYAQKMSLTSEDLGPAAEDEVTRKLLARPLPAPVRPGKSLHRFGVHGMETPFVKAGVNDEQTRRAFELLARVGVDSLRSAEPCWHRLGEKYDNFKEVDYQMAQARQYGMNFCWTVGYPPGEAGINLAPGLSTFKPEYEGRFRDYLRATLPHIAPLAQYIEVCNEVDAPDPWWKGAGSKEYTRDCRIIKEETARLAPGARTVAFAATYSRDEEATSKGAGRAFVRQCFDQGIDDSADAYSLHYTWALDQQDFPAFFRRELAARQRPEKPLLNSEEAAYGKPYDIIKLFARDFYLYDMESVYYYLARDWFEAGVLIHSGLFDLHWHPKWRLLAYAAAVDAMKGRALAGLARPAEGVEAYVLKPAAGQEHQGPAYAVVMWKDGAPEELGPQQPLYQPLAPVTVTGLTGAVTAVNWKLDPLPFDQSRPEFSVGEAPLIVYTDQRPAWKLETPAAFLSHVAAVESQGKALVPGQQ